MMRTVTERASRMPAGSAPARERLVLALTTLPLEDMMAQVKDPVCGMTIDSNSVAATSEYQGTRYYFCSTDCKTEFDENPADYADH